LAFNYCFASHRRSLIFQSSTSLRESAEAGTGALWSTIHAEYHVLRRPACLGMKATYVRVRIPEHGPRKGDVECGEMQHERQDQGNQALMNTGSRYLATQAWISQTTLGCAEIEVFSSYSFALRRRPSVGNGTIDLQIRVVEHSGVGGIVRQDKRPSSDTIDAPRAQCPS